VVQRPALYLGEINDGQREAWCRQIDAFDEASGRHRQLALFPAERAAAHHARGFGVQVKGWSDSADAKEPAFTKDQVLTNLMIYLVTGTIGTSMWMYRGNADDVANVRGKVTVPTGKASLPKESPGLDPPQSILARDYNLVHYTKMPRGGHFAFWEQPELMVADVRQFFRKLRS
jgi:pimeloyl-ACP methyl ester carboxylesterase